MNILLIITIILLCLLLQGFFSGAEMSLISCDRIKVRHMAEQGEARARVTLQLIEEPERFLGATLVGVNVCVVTMSVLSTYLLAHYVPVQLENLVALLVIYPFILLFGEIVPMVTFRHYATNMSIVVSYPLTIVSRALFPLTSIILGVSRIITRFLGTGDRRHSLLTKEDFRVLLDEGKKEQEEQEYRRQMIRHIIRFSDIRARDVMIKKEEVITVPISACTSEVLILIERSGHTVMPVVAPDERVLGVVRATDLFRLGLQSGIAAVVSEPYVVPEDKPIEEVLRELQTNKKNMAIVCTDQGRFTGILTIKDIVEEVVGDIERE